MRHRASVVLCAFAVLWTSAARAQDAPEDAEVSHTRAAAEAYDRGSAFYLNGDYDRAARWFETAYRLAPAAPSLVQALRAQLRAGHALRAANLALRLFGLHGDDEEARSLAQEVVASNSGAFVHLVVECADCELEVDGRAWSYREAMLVPVTEHRVRITEGERSESHSVRGQPGQRITLGPPRDAIDPPADDPTPPPVAGGSRGIPPWVSAVGLGVTLVSAGVLIWSGIDTLDGVDAFNAMPTIEAFEAGEAKELRTNVLVGITAGLAVVTLLLAAVADWDSDPPPTTQAGVFFDVTGGGAWVGARF